MLFLLILHSNFYSDPYRIIDNNKSLISLEFNMEADSIHLLNQKYEFKGFISIPYKSFLLPAYNLSIISPSLDKNDFIVQLIPLDSMEMSIDSFPFAEKLEKKEGKAIWVRDEISSFSKDGLFTVSDPFEFRDYPLARILVLPWDYNEDNRKVKIYNKFFLKVFYKKNIENPVSFSDNFDSYLDFLALNYRQLIGQKIPQKRNLRKVERQFSDEAKFFKFNISDRGIFHINHGDILRIMDENDYRLEDFHIFYGGGKPLDDFMKLEEIDWFKEIPAKRIDKNGNGYWNETDTMLFYCEALFRYDYYPELTPVSSIFDGENVYWLVYDPSFSGKELTIVETGNSQISHSSEIGLEHLYFEENNFIDNPENGGVNWYWNELNSSEGSVFSLKENLPSPSKEDSITLSFNFVGSVPMTGIRIHITVNGNSVYENNSLYINKTKNLINAKITNEYFKQGLNDISIHFNNIVRGSIYFDYLLLQYMKELTGEKQNFFFINESSTEISIKNCENDVFLLNVTDDYSVYQIQPDREENSISFTNNADDQAYYLFYKSDVKKIPSFTEYQWNDLRNVNNGALYVMITPQSLKEQADRLAEYYRNRDGIDVKVVLLDWIYNEFGFGLTDFRAIRNFLYYALHFWEGSSENLEYVLFFGKGDWDYMRKYNLNNSMLFPVYETNILDIDGFIVSDDYFAYFPDENGIVNRSFPELSIGRFSVNNYNEAKILVDKTILFQERKNNDYWRQKIIITADDEYNPEYKDKIEDMHVNNTEKYIIPSVPDYYINKKIYLMSYKMEEKHLAREDLLKEFKDGTIFYNYIGHGSILRLAHESIIHVNDLDEIQNVGKSFFFYASACAVGRNDLIEGQSLGEKITLLNNRGAVGTIAATRSSNANYNEILHGAFVRNALYGGLPVGVALRMAKLNVLNSGYVRNNEKYNLLGDPYLSLSNRKYSVLFSNKKDTLYAGTSYQFYGEVKKLYSNLDEPSQESIQVQLFDSPLEEVHYFNEGRIVVKYNVPGQTLYRGTVSIDDNIIENGFTVPFDVKKDNENGSVLMFSPGLNEIFGAKKGLNILFSDTVEKDSSAPDIRLFFDSEEAGEETIVYPGSVLRAELSDENGINITGVLGHQILLELDNDPLQRYDLTEYFYYDKNSYTDGYLEWKLQDLEVGNHSLRLRCFDNHNNQGEKKVNLFVKKEKKVVLKEIFNYPNPFQEATQFVFFTSSSGKFMIEVFVLTGRRIMKLEGVAASGQNIIPWDGTDWMGDRLSNGTYFYKVTLHDSESGKKATKMGKMVKLN